MMAALLFVGLGGYVGWNSLHAKLFPLAPLYQEPYVVVYGRDECGFTSAMRLGLQQKGVPFTYKIIDQGPVQQELYPRMKYQGISPHHFDLPVVDINSEIMVRPSIEMVVAKYGPAEPASVRQ